MIKSSLKGGGENVKTEHFCVAGSLGQPIPRRHRAGETSKATHENIKYTIFKQFHCKLSLRSSFSQLKVFLGAYWYAGGIFRRRSEERFFVSGVCCKGGAWKVISLLPLPKTLLLSAGYLQVIS